MNNNNYNEPINSNDPDDVDIDREEWNPTHAELTSFLAKDLEYARSNLRLVLKGFRMPPSVRDLRESMLHSGDTLKKALAAEVAANRVKKEFTGASTDQDRYALVVRN